MTTSLTPEYLRLDSALSRFFGDGFGEDYEFSLQDLKRDFAEAGTMLCGGAITSIYSGMKINDLDFYVRDEAGADKLRKAILTRGYEEVCISRNAMTYKRKSVNSRKVWTIQIITRFMGPPSEIFDTFDFTITQGAYDFNLGFTACEDNHAMPKGGFVLGTRFLEDIARRRLVYLGGSRYPLCAMYRTKKYEAKGYRLPGSTIMHIGISIMRLELETYGDLKEQLNGIDTQFLGNILGDYDDMQEDAPLDYSLFLERVFEKMTPELFD
jgi:hypothetical protein